MLYVFLHPLLILIDAVFGIYITIIIAAVIASWLVAFGVLNLSNPLARQLVQLLDNLTEPVFRRVRRFVPPMGGLDLSPIIVWIALILVWTFLDDLILYLMGLR